MHDRSTLILDRNRTDGSPDADIPGRTLSPAPRPLRRDYDVVGGDRLHRGADAMPTVNRWGTARSPSSRPCSSANASTIRRPECGPIAPRSRTGHRLDGEHRSLRRTRDPAARTELPGSRGPSSTASAPGRPRSTRPAEVSIPPGVSSAPPPRSGLGPVDMMYSEYFLANGTSVFEFVNRMSLY